MIPSDFPAPLSAIDSFQSVPVLLYATVIWPLGLSLGKACLSAFMTTSVTIKPRLSASRDEAVPGSIITLRTMGRVSPIIEIARLSHSLVR